MSYHTTTAIKDVAPQFSTNPDPLAPSPHGCEYRDSVSGRGHAAKISSPRISEEYTTPINIGGKKGVALLGHYLIECVLGPHLTITRPTKTPACSQSREKK